MLELGQVDGRRRRRPVERRGSLGVHVRGVIGNCGLGVELLCNLGGDIGSRQGTAVDAQLLANALREQADALLVDMHPLYAGYSTGVGKDMAFEALADPVDKLMGQIEDQYGGILDRVDQGRVGAQVVGQSDVWQVLDVLVQLVDDLRQVLLALAQRRGLAVVPRRLGDLDLLLVHPHIHLLLEQIWVSGRVFGDHLRDRGAPRAIVGQSACE